MPAFLQALTVKTGFQGKIPANVQLFSPRNRKNGSSPLEMPALLQAFAANWLFELKKPAVLQFCRDSSDVPPLRSTADVYKTGTFPDHNAVRRYLLFSCSVHSRRLPTASSSAAA